MRIRCFISSYEVSICLFLASVLGSAIATSAAGEDLFRDCLVPSLQIEIPREGLDGLIRSPRKYVRANVREGARTYTNVAVHLKGGPGSFRPLQDVPAFTLNFDRFSPGQTFHGLKKIHLNNSVQDHSYQHEKLSRELFEAAGVPVPRAGNAWVDFNDRKLGMYVLLEGVNKQFLKRYFKNVKGNVYDGHSGSDVNQPMPTNSGENRRDKSRLRALADAAREPDLEKRLARLEETLDVDRFLTFVAMEIALGHWDGYTMNQNNFRIYHDQDTDRMVFLPHGMDQVLSRKYSIFPQGTAGMVARSVWEVPQLRERYRARMAEITTNLFVVAPLTNRVQQVAAKIEEVLDRKDPDEAEAHRKRTASLCRSIRARFILLENQISPAPALQFDGIGVLHLTNWVSKVDLGEAKLDEEKNSSGAPLLHIATASGCTASWRTTCALPPGEYRFSARIKTKGVVLAENDARAGAGLRISRHRLGQKNAGDREWTNIAFEFAVPENQDETELVCELRATKGEIWYDLSSLKLLRK